jgi:UDP-N-acetylglucosamine 2-epimerase (non-hydrolysing)
MAPLVRECLERSHEVQPIVVFSGQHKEMLASVAEYFAIKPDVDLSVMVPGQSLAELTARCLTALDQVIATQKPDCIVAQGDTSTAMTSAMAAFFRGIPFVHVEAGLRTGDLIAPFPEEYHRRVAAITTSLHCAPTQRSANNLLREHIDPANVRVTGNTVIDALLATRDRELARAEYWSQKHPELGTSDVVLITAHRRENHGDGLVQIFTAIRNLAQRFPAVKFVFPLHRNPQVMLPAQQLLGGLANVQLLEPLSYPEFVWMMNRARLIVSDSGGVQEEAPSLGKPVVVTREVTERPEACDAGALVLVGTDADLIEREVTQLLTDAAAYQAMQIEQNPYGDGQAASRIVDWMLERFVDHIVEPQPAADQLRVARPR